ncbi:hypothetical protein ACTL32_02185, partial [Planococcus sp. FY231025]|uniref:hypothetical protein n=1 Tax=Planococcus sp. FY231025 TaxID=3455699 RepID=UPI003F9195DD
MKKTAGFVLTTVLVLTSLSAVYSGQEKEVAIERIPEPWSVRSEVAIERIPEPWSVRQEVAIERIPEPW